MSDRDKLNYIDNPLLFFIYNKVDCMKEPDIISLCKNIYDDLEVQIAKNLAFKLYKIEGEKINRKGANKLVSDLQDIIKIIRTKILDENIKLCITSCNKLPSVSLDYIDA